MANAIARAAGVYQSPTNPNNLAVALEVAFGGLDLPADFNGSVTVGLYVEFPADSQPAAIRTAMSSAIGTYAQTNGFNVPTGNMVIPTLQKG